MKERPILFNAEMVNAILAGRKTQTRRVVKPQPRVTNNQICYLKETVSYIAEYGWGADEPPNDRFVAECCPYGVLGDRLKVRETIWQWGRWGQNGHTKTGKPKRKFVPVGKHAVYVADSPECPKEAPETIRTMHADTWWVKRPAIFAPRWASRITLEITDVRVQRLQEIDNLHAMGEGIGHLFGWTRSEIPADARAHFAHLWNSINEMHGFGWATNPWVWALTFQRIENERSDT